MSSWLPAWVTEPRSSAAYVGVPSRLHLVSGSCGKCSPRWHPSRVQAPEAVEEGHEPPGAAPAGLQLASDSRGQSRSWNPGAGRSGAGDRQGTLSSPGAGTAVRFLGTGLSGHRTGQSGQLTCSHAPRLRAPPWILGKDLPALLSPVQSRQKPRHPGSETLPCR